MRSRLRFRANSHREARTASRALDDDLTRMRQRYLDLVKRALTHLLYRPMDVHFGHAGYAPSEELRAAAAEELSKPDFDWADVRADGRDWPQFAQTMVGLRRLDNVQQCMERVIAEGVPGDLIETGVWRGGVAIFMRAVLDAFGDETRSVFAADSFCGLPPPAENAPAADIESRFHEVTELAVAREDVERNFELYGLLDERVHFLEGWFKDTLPTLRDHRWAIVRLDGDLYESTMDGLEHLYPGLSVGGFLIVDDYTYEPCRQAVREFRERNEIDEPIVQIDWLGAFWRRTR